MKELFSVLFILISVCSFGQIIFEKGYFIDNSNQKTECLIKNEDWKNNPKIFIFKQNESDIPEKGNIESVREFGIYGVSKFIRCNVNIDRSNNDINKLNSDMQPVWSQEQLFLKVLIEGKASLYFYEDGHLKRFFYSVGNKPVNQLIYKQFLVDELNIAYNNRFRQQLWLDVRCPEATTNSLQNTNYLQRDLEKYFLNYLKCTGDSMILNFNKAKSDLFNLKIASGLNISSLTLFPNRDDLKYFEFKSDASLRLGLEAEFILPFQKNKWGILIEPTYQYFNGQKEIANVDGSMKSDMKINYSSIEIPVGVRHYFFMNEESKLYVNGSYISNFCLNFNPKIKLSNPIFGSNSYDITPNGSFALGGGIQYKKLSIEIRYYTKRDLMFVDADWSTDYHRYSIIIGYQLLNKKS
jgi:hypothetical protein